MIEAFDFVIITFIFHFAISFKCYCLAFIYGLVNLLFMVLTVCLQLCSLFREVQNAPVNIARPHAKL